MIHDASSKAALVVIDVQRAFDEWEAAGKRRNNPEALARIVELLAAFRLATRRFSTSATRACAPILGAVEPAVGIEPVP